MKIKTIILVAFCALGLYFSEAHATTSETIYQMTTDNIPGILEEIELRGDLMNSIGPNAVEAGLGREAIYIQFNRSCGYVDIFIYNENGQQIYCSTVNTAVQQMVVVPITNITNGGFYIVLSNATGCAEGEAQRY